MTYNLIAQSKQQLLLHTEQQLLLLELLLQRQLQLQLLLELINIALLKRVHTNLSVSYCDCCPFSCFMPKV